MENKKYLITDETKIVSGITLRRIKKTTGELGGWIEKESNLSQAGQAWVCGEAQVSGEARVSGNAWVSGNAQVCGKALVCGEALVCGDARVFGAALVSGAAGGQDR